MATIKSYTDLEQSRKLAKILPLESADAFYIIGKEAVDIVVIYGFVTHKHLKEQIAYKRAVPCWSLAALLDIVKTYSIRLEIALRVDKNYNIFAVSGDFVFRSFDECSEGYDNLVDACVAMIEKLHELKIL